MLYTKEEKLKIVKMYLAGIIEYPPNATQKQKRNVRKKIKMWVGLYKAQGEIGLESKTHQYSYEDKKYAVERVLAGESKYQIAFSMGITNTKQIRYWVKQYQENGWNALRRDGNRKKYFNVKVRITTKLKEAQEEIEFLRKTVKEQNIEIEYLKKLNALVNQRRGQ